WSLNPRASEGWGPDDLLPLVRSADLEVHADALFGEGADRAELQVRRADDKTLVGPERTLKRGDGFAVVTIPLTDNLNDQYETVATGTTPNGTSQSASAKLSLKVGEDRRVDLCPGVTMKADPSRVAADGTSSSRISLSVSTCDGERDVANKPIDWTLTPAT